MFNVDFVGEENVPLVIEEVLEKKLSFLAFKNPFDSYLKIIVN